MTNNEEIKKDAVELLDRILKFKSKYKNLTGKHGSPIVELERELRLILMVARTDEENSLQSKSDCYC